MKASKFTPEVMISAPRRQPGIPNHDASLILYTTTSYSFKTHDSTTEIRVLHAKSEESLLVERHKKSSDPVWLDGYSHEMALLRGAEDDTTQLIIGDVDNFDKRFVCLHLSINRLTLPRAANDCLPVRTSQVPLTLPAPI